MNKRILEEDVQRFAQQFELWECLRGKSFLITGATGLIGSVMIKCLSYLNVSNNLGLRIRAVIRDPDKAQKIFEESYPCVEFIVADLFDLSTELLKDINYVIHMASPTNGKFIERHPVETFNLAYLVTKKILLGGGKLDAFLYVSSLEYYGQNDDDRLITEDMQGFLDTESTRSAYSIGKEAAENLCKYYALEYGIPAKIARLTQTFGAGVEEDDGRVFAQFAKSARDGKDIILHTKGDSAKPYCYITDAVSAMLYILLRGEKGEAYNVANKDSYISISDLANFVQQRYNKKAKVVISLNDTLGYAPQTRLHLDTSKIESLGWRARYGLGEMFDRLMAYMGG